MKRVIAELAAQAALVALGSVSRVLWQLGAHAKNGGYVLVEVSMDRFEKVWKGSWQYIGPDDKGISDRRDRLMKALSARSAQKWDAPEVGYGEGGGKIMFVDGRHRTAVLRDLGAKTIGMAVHPNDVERFKKETGAVEKRAPKSTVSTPICDCRPAS